MKSLKPPTPVELIAPPKKSLVKEARTLVLKSAFHIRKVGDGIGEVCGRCLKL